MTSNKYATLRATIARAKRHDCQKVVMRVTLVEEVLLQLSNAEKRIAELAAENGQMLRLLADISDNHEEYVNQDEYLYAGVPMDYVSEINAYVSRDVEAENPFKETDTFLAEVRASGVEMFASVLESRGRHQDYVEIANAYAAQIRKGVQS
ncbi:TPA: hypothetical protein ACXJU5_004268 [Enterobacter ludwigii]